MDLVTGRRNRVPVAQLDPADAEDDRAARARARLRGASSPGIEEILRRGNAADRQLRIFNANRDVVEVVRDIADADRDRRGDRR